MNYQISDLLHKALQRNFSVEEGVFLFENAPNVRTDVTLGMLCDSGMSPTVVTWIIDRNSNTHKCVCCQLQIL